jgi:valyl-tRNA synthetase
LNQWLLHNLNITYTTYLHDLDQYEYTTALEIAEKFFWSDFCDNYLELVKDRLFNPDKYSPEIIAETQSVLYEAGFALLQLFAPFIPHITETLYQSFCRDIEKTPSLHRTQFESARFNYNFEHSMHLITNVLHVVGTIRKLKSEKQLSLKTELHRVEIYGQDPETLNALKSQEQLIAGISKATSIQFITKSCEESVLQESPEGLIAKVTLS